MRTGVCSSIFIFFFYAKGVDGMTSRHLPLPHTHKNILRIQLIYFISELFSFCFMSARVFLWFVFADK